MWLGSALRTGAPQSSELSEAFSQFLKSNEDRDREDNASTEIDSVVGNEAIGSERIQPRVVLS